MSFENSLQSLNPHTRKWNGDTVELSVQFLLFAEMKCPGSLNYFKNICCYGNHQEISKQGTKLQEFFTP